MWRLALLLWVIIATVFAGVGLVIVLMIPSMAPQAMKLIPYAALLGAAFAMPVSVLAAKMIASRTPA